MLVQPRWGTTPTPPTGAIGMLLDCHERIRRFCTLGFKLATTAELPPEHAADAAGQLVRYFGIALPLHVLDEDESLAPLLSADPKLKEILAILSTQHRELDAALEPLLDSWRRLVESPERDRTVLVEGSRALSEHFETHLRLEELELFPAARRVITPEQDRALVEAFRARRQPA